MLTIESADVAICHLFLYCCFKDGQFTSEELDTVAGKFTQLEMQKEVNFKTEMAAFRSYLPGIENEREYLAQLIASINPTNEAALFSYCVELMLSDDKLESSEEQLLIHLAALLNISDETRNVITRLYIQRKVVSTQKFF